MAKNDDTKRYTADELAALRRNGDSCFDLARVVATTKEELEASMRQTGPEPWWAFRRENKISIFGSTRTC